MVLEQDRDPLERVSKDTFQRLVYESRFSHYHDLIGGTGELFSLGRKGEWTRDTREFLRDHAGSWFFLMTASGLFLYVEEPAVAAAYWLRFGGV